jgi:peptidoglycan L-alanyl-D-glutamate endopeptidase CwlK
MGKQEKIFDYLGITKWHEAGYTGKGIKILSIEPVSSKDKFPNVIAVNGYNEGNLKYRNHGDNVMQQMMEIAPNATFITCSQKGNTDNWKPLWLDYILNNKVHLFTSSYLSAVYKTSSSTEKYMQECIDNGTTFFIAAGNTSINGGGKDIHEEAKSDKYLTIGACDYYDGSVGKAHYSCEGEELDYMTIVGYNGETGASFATNRFAAMCALVQEFFLEKAGRTLYRHELIAFINDNVKDLKTEGFDIYTGYGILILPDPETIKISHYVTDTNVGDPIYYGGFPEVRSDFVMRGIDKLHPELQVCVNKFLEECKNQGLNVLVTETLRTLEEQEALYAQGRTKPGNIVTNARGYQSPHAWGVAFDFCRNVKGREYDNTDGFFEKVGKIAKTIFDGTEYDLFWGGDFKTFVDKPHVEMIKYLPNNSTKWLIDTYKTPEEFMKTWEVKDVEEVSEWAKTAWEWCKERGYLDGTNPKGTVTREMLAQVLFNLFGKEK